MPRNLVRELLGVFLAFLFLFLFIFTGEVKAWGGDVHSYLCPGSYDCTIADSREFKIAYKWDSFGHLCLDNQSDCLARLGAKYFLKKYYSEGKKDWKLIATAAHLYQDASCPDHWYPMREYFGRIIIPLAPSWVTKIEGGVSRNLSFRPQPGDKRDDWNIPIIWQGQKIDINKAYLDNAKESLKNFVSQEPQENLEDLKRQIDTKMTMTLIRSYKEIAYLILILVFLVWLYTLWALKKKGQKSDLLIASAMLAILVIYFVFLRVFW